MYGRKLTRRTGRVIATGRAVLALAFLLALWIDPAVPVRGAIWSYVLVNAYLIWTAALMMVSWRSWWYDFRLATLAQSIDIVVFLSAVYFTESRYSEFQSPFLAFAAFLIVAAMVRWNWRAAALTAIVLLAANLIVGLTIYELGLDINLFRFSRRAVYMILLSCTLIWLSLSRGGGQTIIFPDPPGLLGERWEQLLDSALSMTARTFDAGQVALAFAGSEEPWIEVRHLSPAGISASRHGPASFGDELTTPRPTAIFNIARQRQLVFAEPGVEAITGPVELRLAELVGANEGLIVPIQSVTGCGHLVAWDCSTLGPDDLALMRVLAEQIGHALDREVMSSLARRTAEIGVRHAVARDLHDSVAQFLAGTLFRLEALRRWIRDGNDPEGEIDSIKNALRREQGHLRLLIERLRRGEEGDRRTEIADELRDLLAEAGTHWHIETELIIPDRPQPISVVLSHEIRQLVREGIANAVRHGKCSKVRVELADENGLLKLSITDDGIGFPNLPGTARPRSISERVEALGGQLIMRSNPSGARLEIVIRSGEPQ